MNGVEGVLVIHRHTEERKHDGHDRGLRFLRQSHKPAHRFGERPPRFFLHKEAGEIIGIRLMCARVMEACQDKTEGLPLPGELFHPPFEPQWTESVLHILGKAGRFVRFDLRIVKGYLEDNEVRALGDSLLGCVDLM